MEGVEGSNVNVEGWKSPFDVNKYQATRSLVTSLTKLERPMSDRGFKQTLTQIRNNGSILTESLNDDQYVLPTLETIMQFQSIEYHRFLPDEKVQEARQLGHTLVSQNLPQIERALQRPVNKKHIKFVMDLIEKACNYGHIPPFANEIDFLIKHFEEGLEMYNSPSFDEEYPEMTMYSWMAKLMFIGNNSQREQAIQMLKHAADNPAIKTHALRVINHLAGSVELPDTTLAEIRIKLVKPILEQFGLDYNELIKAWLGGIHLIGEFMYNELNLNRIFGLEEIRPGICKTLVSEFDIRNFHRYPKDLLVDLYDQRDNREISSYGLMIYPKDDHSGAFYMDGEVLEKFYQQLKSLGFGLRLYEVGSKYDLARAFLASKRRYGIGNKIAFVILGGHGDPTSITFGAIHKATDEDVKINMQNARSILNQADFETRGTQRAGHLLAEDATVILLSCSTGAEEGIAKTISEKYPQTSVIAPDIPTGLNSLEVTKDTRGKLHFKVTYSTGTKTSKTFSAGQPV